MDAVEFDGAVGVDEVAEHAGAADGGELQGVTDQGEAPAPGVGQIRDHSSTHVTRGDHTHVTPPMQSDAADRVARAIFGDG